jgi:hypothetical protein
MDFVRGTMLFATVAWAIGEVLMRRSLELDRLARWSWTAGIALAFVHVYLAFEVVYRWDHEAAIVATAQQAAARFGQGWRGGIYVNYVFIAVWFGDVCWWWVAPRSHATRSFVAEAVRLAFFVFMFVNGAIIFASAPGRWVGMVAVAAVLLGSPLRRKRAVPA